MNKNKEKVVCKGSKVVCAKTYMSGIVEGHFIDSNNDKCLTPLTYKGRISKFVIDFREQ